MPAKSFYSSLPNLLFEHITCQLYRDDLKRLAIHVVLGKILKMLHENSLSTDDLLKSPNELIAISSQTSLVRTPTGQTTTSVL